jgi:hypothetical protein
LPRKNKLEKFSEGMREALQALSEGGTGVSTHKHFIKSLVTRKLATSYLSEEVDEEGCAIMHYRITREGKAKLAE